MRCWIAFLHDAVGQSPCGIPCPTVNSYSSSVFIDLIDCSSLCLRHKLSLSDIVFNSAHRGEGAGGHPPAHRGQQIQRLVPLVGADVGSQLRDDHLVRRGALPVAQLLMRPAAPAAPACTASKCLLMVSSGACTDSPSNKQSNLFALEAAVCTEIKSRQPRWLAEHMTGDPVALASATLKLTGRGAWRSSPRCGRAASSEPLCSPPGRHRRPCSSAAPAQHRSPSAAGLQQYPYPNP